ncbi:NAD-dependent epimerase/dehydratase family protein [Allosphingosinicella flava]|uniref:NAD-dependent epimerase/dehydratase family protein n=1 Tax=Allosphingosinicella flava TaxID=2771430 RepID=A0A7T2GIC8_9SPHN|nr:NAD-dependent epimerase/dehydratase family protein [Sphingosinicella flava]QPQ54434.1 NAD-dependent epimerase/dehydratase family protein [Sphingosinicella flava]
MRLLVTGANGFLGKNVVVRAGELGHEVIRLGRDDDQDAWSAAVRNADVVVHLAGVNRATEEFEFAMGNVELTQRLCDLLARAGNRAPILYSSSIQAGHDHPYGQSKAAAEDAQLDYSSRMNSPVAIFRLPNVFGKWARPNYNSAVATFCHRVARDEPIEVHDAAAALQLVYVDDVVDTFLRLIEASFKTGYHHIAPVYETTVGEVADIIRSFPLSRDTLITPRVGTGLVRALYSTYLSYLPTECFEYHLPIHADPRGRFVEMLKTPDCGQFSYFTAGPGVTRGDHYHHSKVEKFLVISGTARFGFRHIQTEECHEIVVQGQEARVVETIPGWTHNITNIGEGELVVMLWANEIFDRDRPDTFAMKV